MKTIILIIAVFVASLVNAQTPQGTNITASVDKLNGKEGKVYFALFTEENFMKQPTLAEIGEIKDGIVSVTFQNVPEGKYAILCFYDENGNERMDFETNGMPKELYGASNNMLSFGPPLWSESSFAVDKEPVEIEIVF